MQALDWTVGKQWGVLSPHQSRIMLWHPLAHALASLPAYRLQPLPLPEWQWRRM